MVPVPCDGPSKRRPRCEEELLHAAVDGVHRVKGVRLVLLASPPAGRAADEVDPGRRRSRRRGLPPQWPAPAPSATPWPTSAPSAPTSSPNSLARAATSPQAWSGYKVSRLPRQISVRRDSPERDRRGERTAVWLRTG